MHHDAWIRVMSTAGVRSRCLQRPVLQFLMRLRSSVTHHDLSGYSDDTFMQNSFAGGWGSSEQRRVLPLLHMHDADNCNLCIIP